MSSNTSLWDSSNKGANIVLSDHYYIGPNAFAVNTGSGVGYNSVRSLTSTATSGGTLAYFEVYSYYREITPTEGRILVGPGTSSVSTSSYVGNNTSGSGWLQNNTLSAVIENASGVGNAPVWDEVTLACVFWDMTNNRWAMSSDLGVTWYKAGGPTSVNPLTDGQTISFSGTTYFWGSVYDGSTSKLLFNGGGWPFVGALPSGAVGLDPNYPGSISTLTVTWNATYSNITASQNSMRVKTTTTGTAVLRAARASKAIPANSKVAWDTIIECGRAGGGGSGQTYGVTVGILDTSADVSTVSDSSASSARYSSDGSYAVASGGPSGAAGTLPTFKPGDIVTTAVRWESGNEYIWWSVNGGNWNGNASADPGANTTGAISLSAVSALTVAPVVGLVNDTLLTCASANFGATTLSRSLPTGFVTLEDAGGARTRNRGYIIQ